ncbi:MAG: hypothetical protein ACK5LC_00435, partial [Coprobacillaceae bacterium]
MKMRKMAKIFLSTLLCITSFTGYMYAVEAEGNEETENPISEEESSETESEIESETEEGDTTESMDVTEEETVAEEDTVGALLPLQRSGGYFETTVEGTWWVNENGGVKVAILNYNPTVGWKTAVSYTVEISTEFTDYDGVDRAISLTIPEGMKYTSYEVQGETASGTESPEKTMTGVNDSLIKSSTNPEKNSYYESYNGTLKYDINDTNTKKIDYRVTVTPDVALYYGPKTIVDAIKVTASENSAVIGEVAVNVDATGTAGFSITDNGLISSSTITGLANSDTKLQHMSLSPYRTGEFNMIPLYAKSVEVDYYYPKEVNFISASAGFASVDRDTGHLKLQFDNKTASYIAFSSIYF